MLSLWSVLQTLEFASLRIRSRYLKNPTKKYNSLSCHNELLSRTECKNRCFVKEVHCSHKTGEGHKYFSEVFYWIQGWRLNTWFGWEAQKRAVEEEGVCQWYLKIIAVWEQGETPTVPTTHFTVPDGEAGKKIISIFPFIWCFRELFGHKLVSVQDYPIPHSSTNTCQWECQWGWWFCNTSMLVPGW